jgi:hypothetical protein
MGDPGEAALDVGDEVNRDFPVAAGADYVVPELATFLFCPRAGAL